MEKKKGLVRQMKKDLEQRNFEVRYLGMLKQTQDRMLKSKNKQIDEQAAGLALIHALLFSVLEQQGGSAKVPLSDWTRNQGKMVVVRRDKDENGDLIYTLLTNVPEEALDRPAL